jgi:hypothetical protein
MVEEEKTRKDAAVPPQGWVRSSQEFLFAGAML